MVTLKTNLGDIVIELDKVNTPETAKNFSLMQKMATMMVLFFIASLTSLWYKVVDLPGYDAKTD